MGLLSYRRMGTRGFERQTNVIISFRSLTGFLIFTVLTIFALFNGVLRELINYYFVECVCRRVRGAQHENCVTLHVDNDRMEQQCPAFGK